MLSHKKMYRCDKCGRVTTSGQEALVVVDSVRDVTYPNGSEGQETVKQSKVCRTCYGLEELPEPPSPKHVEKKEPEGCFSLKLANGKELTTSSGYEMVNFLESKGSSIDRRPKKGGKSKGARGRGRKTVKQTRDER